MTWVLVTWLAYSCPGGPLGHLLPNALKPFACTQTVEVKVIGNKKRAYHAVEKAGCAARPRIFWCKGLKCYEKKVECPVGLYIQGEKIK